MRNLFGCIVTSAALMCLGESNLAADTLPISQFGTWAVDQKTGDTGYNLTTGRMDEGANFLYPSQPVGMQYQFYNSYVVLDLTSFPSTEVITGVTFSANFRCASGPITDPLDLLTTTTPASVLEAAGNQMPSVFNSLQNGSLLGEGTGTTTQGDFVDSSYTVTGNSAFLALLNANIGEQVAIGTHLNLAGTQNWMVAGAVPGQGDPTFTITTAPAPVPEPGTLYLSAAAVAGLWLQRARSRRK